MPVISEDFTRRVTLSDLEMSTTPVAQQRKSAETATVAVTRASVRQEYNVPVEGTDLRAAAVGQ